jgi:hypothetical protein
MSNDKREFLNSLKTYRKSNKAGALMFSSFVDNLLSQKQKEYNNQYPRVIKVAPSVKDMLKGNFEPSQIITLTAPLLHNGYEVWPSNSLDKIELQVGYENSDKRYLSTYALDSELKAHATLAGTTGSGKSATTNSILFSMMYQYAPWELELIMTDAKIAEFKRYGIGEKLPHIRTISATEDVNFLISVLEEYNNEMMEFNKLLGKLGVQNLRDFRETTGLTVPRRVLVMDEYQAMFKFAKKKAGYIADKMDSVGRLGRNGGFHMYLASQEVDENIKPILENIATRMCLKCSPKVSEMILGNNEGALGDVGIGRIYLNNNAGAGKKEDNTKFRVPFQPKTEFEACVKELHELGKKVKWDRPLNFYDETDPIDIDKLRLAIEKKESSKSIVIGEPSFISTTPDRLELVFENRDIENILVYTNNSTDLYRYFKTIYQTCLHDKAKDNCNHIFLAADDYVMQDIDPERDGFVRYSVRDSSSNVWKSYLDSVNLRQLVIDADELAFNDIKYDESSENLLKEYVESNISKENEINKSRVFRLNSLLRQNNYLSMFGLTRVVGKELEEKIAGLITRSMKLIKITGSQYLSSQITKRDLSEVIIHVVGIDKLNGIGRASNTLSLGQVKQVLMDSFRVNIKFILYCTSIDEFSSDIKHGVRYCILDKVEKYANRIDCEDYPDKVQEVCGVLFDKILKQTRLFKRLTLDTDI